MSEVLFKEENLVDLSSLTSVENFLFEFTNIIEKDNLQGKKIKLNFGKINLSQEHIINMLSVLKAFGTEVDMIYSDSKETKFLAIEAGLTVSGQSIKKIIPEEQIFENFNINEVDIPEEDELEKILNQENLSIFTEKRETLYIKQTLRSGQKIEHDGNIVLIGDCNAGSEIIASGDIVVWGFLSGFAHAGKNGDSKASIKAFKISAIQLKIANYLARKPDTLEIDKSEKTTIFTPEEAKIFEDEIVIYSLDQNYN